MSIEDFSPDIDSSESSWNSAESAQSGAEKFQEDKKRWDARIKRASRDEKKAKKYDFLLAGFLVKIILDKKYDTILTELIGSTHKWYPSNFVLWILSLIHLDISDRIREVSQKENIDFNFQIPAEVQKFDDIKMDSIIQDRINYWIEDILDSVQIEYSQVATKKLLELLLAWDPVIQSYIQKVFKFFLAQINMQITDAKSESISKFIIWEIEGKIKVIKLEEI